MKRVLLDQGLAPKTAAILRSNGWDAVHVSEEALDRAEDLEILEFARDRGMVCVTLDHDFHAHLALSLSQSPSVVLVRGEGMSAEQQAELIKAVWEVCGEAIASGAAVSTDGRAVRFHRLPLK
jgi:predicted nuclease of predicted toxin-antitoxin system